MKEGQEIPSICAGAHSTRLCGAERELLKDSGSEHLEVKALQIISFHHFYFNCYSTKEKKKGYIANK